jgi:hypothetical protein
MRFYWLICGILAVWRAAHLFYGEDGPWDVFVRLRRAVGDGLWGSLLDCFYCLSLWMALPFAFYIGESWKERLLLWPAMSAGAILLQKLATIETSPVILTPDKFKEAEDVLRQ